MTPPSPLARLVAAVEACEEEVVVDEWTRMPARWKDVLAAAQAARPVEGAEVVHAHDASCWITDWGYEGGRRMLTCTSTPTDADANDPTFHQWISGQYEDADVEAVARAIYEAPYLPGDRMEQCRVLARAALAALRARREA
jgi:hypothetical protein